MPPVNPFKKQMVTVQRTKNGVPDTSNFSVGGFEVTVDEIGCAEVPDWAARQLEAHGFKVVDPAEAKAAEKARQEAAKAKTEKKA